MEHNDFEFPPDPIHHNYSSFPSLQSIPISVLTQTPIEQLPPTTTPSSGNYSIRQIMRSAMCFETKSNFGGYRSINTNVTGADNGKSFSHRSSSVDPFALDTTPALRKDENPETEPQGAPCSTETTNKETINAHEGYQRVSRNRRPRAEWTEGELRNFFHALSQYGTDFGAISVLFPGRSRTDVKLLYRREMRKRPNRVRAALQKKKGIDLATFQMFLREKQAREQPPKKVLALEEEQLLQKIERIEPVPQGDVGSSLSTGGDRCESDWVQTPENVNVMSTTDRSFPASVRKNEATDQNYLLQSSSAEGDPDRPSKRKRDVSVECDEESRPLQMPLDHPNVGDGGISNAINFRVGLGEFDFSHNHNDETEDGFLFN